MTAPPGPAPAVDLRGLRQTFATRAGEVVAVDHLDLRVEVGEVVALLGPNGAGKTTALDVVLGLTRPAGGTARVLGLPPREAVRQGRVAAVLQTGGLLADLTVGETLRYVAATYPCPRGRVAEVVEHAGLHDLVRRRVSRCSGGEQQRLRFALALLPDPELLVLDEPTAGMDVMARRSFWRAMHEQASRGRTVVFATHHLEEADAFAERLVLVARGRVVADGPTHEVRARALGRVVSAAVPDTAAARRRLAGLGEVSADDHRVRVRTGDSDAVARALLNELGAHDLEVVGGSLEDAFLQLTADPADPADPPDPAGEAR